ncbi:MAG: PEGA domain-containing protein [Lachnospiraceae bacterium]|nr:PEGA domain-containing protein [Lachnospiraceae bacterium]
MVKVKRTGILLTVCILCILVVTACTNNNQRRRGNMAASEPPVKTQSVTGVVTMQDTEQQKITVRELDSDLETIIYYDATAVVTNKYQETITADQITVGEILETEYRAADTVLVSALVPKDVWEYNEVGSFSFRTEENMMQFAGKKYQYSTGTYISSGEQVIDFLELSKQDELTVRGVGFKVYSIVRTSGHGYIRMTNYQDFMGGMVEVGSRIILPLTENMLITAPEGIYRLTLVKGAAVTSKTITVRNDEEVVADFSDYAPSMENIKLIVFNIEPDGADLYINGTKVDYSQPVALNYGEYRIAVAMNGYDSYTGTLDVEEDDPNKKYITVNIDLIEEVASVGEKTTATATPAANNNNSSDDSTATTKQVDSDHTITITAPRGAEVYLNDVYKGLAPCKFKKIIGSQTITLRRTGYITKSYSIDILDDGENVTLSFAELAEDADTPTTTDTTGSTDSTNTTDTTDTDGNG